MAIRGTFTETAPNWGTVTKGTHGKLSKESQSVAQLTLHSCEIRACFSQTPDDMILIQLCFFIRQMACVKWFGYSFKMDFVWLFMMVQFANGVAEMSRTLSHFVGLV